MKLFAFPLVFLFLTLALAGQQEKTSVPVPGSGADSLRSPSPAFAQATVSAGQETMTESWQKFTRAPVFRKALTALQDSMRLPNAVEVSVSFGHNSNGDTLASGFVSGSKRSVSIPAVQNGFADLHTHPGNTPPSSGDVYGLLAANSKSHRYTKRFVLLRNGTLYLLLVNDSEAAASFHRHYPPQRLPGYSPLFPEKLLDAFREARFLHGMTEDVAMATILEQYKAGVLLFRRDAQTLDWIQVRGEVGPGLLSLEKRR